MQTPSLIHRQRGYIGLSIEEQKRQAENRLIWWRRILSIVTVALIVAVVFAFFYPKSTKTETTIIITTNNSFISTGPGLEQDVPTGNITVSHTLTVQTLLPFEDPMGPQVSYLHTIGPTLANVWGMSPFPGFSLGFTPGLIPGDGGQGNSLSGTNWTVPAIGQYNFNVDCQLDVLNFEGEFFGGIVLAINLGATTVDPHDSGFIPPGGITSTTGPVGTRVSYSNRTRVSVAAAVHAGCLGCPVAVGAALTLHTFIKDNFNGVNPSTEQISAICNIQVSRSK